MPWAPASMLRMKRACPGTSTMPIRRPLGRRMFAKPRSIVMPRRFSSASLSGSIPVSAVTRVDLPWSMWPAVPRITSENAYALDRRLHSIDELLVLAAQDSARIDAASILLDSGEDGGNSAAQCA